LAAKGKNKRTLPLSEVEGPPITVALSEGALRRLSERARKANMSESKAFETLVMQFSHKVERGEEADARSAHRAKNGNGQGELETALLNLVNLGNCELYVPSLFDRQWMPMTVQGSSSLERALSKAFRVQLRTLASDRRPALPTRVKWTRDEVINCAPEVIGQYVWLWRLFDELIKHLAVERTALRVVCCKHCKGFVMTSKSRGAPRHYCVEEHRSSAPGRKDTAGYMRNYRATLKAGAVSRGDRSKK